MSLASRRYTVVLADRTTGAVRRLTISVRTAVGAVAAVLAMPILIGLGAHWQSRAETAQLRSQNSVLTIENGNYREATGELTTQIQSLSNVIEDLGQRSELDPAQRRAMQRLQPSLFRAKAVGGTAGPPNAVISTMLSTLTNPDDTFGALRDLLRSLEGRLTLVRKDVERQEKLAAATPSIWPTPGWLTGYFGGRSDPFTGEPGFHQGLDISSPLGSAVAATADGVVESAAYNGDYGNLIVIKHDFGLSTRYGHLGSFRVQPGTKVKRGDIIGYVGSTGRSTGSHLHYEILVNGQLINPLRLLTTPDQPR